MENLTEILKGVLDGCVLETIRREQTTAMKSPEGSTHSTSRMWQFAGGDGMEMLKTQYELISLIESGAAEVKHVLDVTGDDVAGFCDEFMRDTKKWQDHFRNKLNGDVSKLREGANHD